MPRIDPKFWIGDTIIHTNPNVTRLSFLVNDVRERGYNGQGFFYIVEQDGTGEQYFIYDTTQKYYELVQEKTDVKD